MSLSGEVNFVGSPTAERMEGLVRTNNGTILGVNSDTDGIYRIDPLTGQETLIGLPGVDLVAGLAYDPSTDIVYTVTSESGSLDLRTVDPQTGELGIPTTTAPTVLRASNLATSTFYDFNLATETAVAVPRQSGSPPATTLDTRADGTIFGLQGNSLNQYDFPTAGSSATTLSTLSSTIEAISFDASDQLFGVSTTSQFHQIDPTTGACRCWTRHYIGRSRDIGNHWLRHRTRRNALHRRLDTPVYV